MDIARLADTARSVNAGAQRSGSVSERRWMRCRRVFRWAAVGSLVLAACSGDENTDGEVSGETTAAPSMRVSDEANTSETSSVDATTTTSLPTVGGLAGPVVYAGPPPFVDLAGFENRLVLENSCLYLAYEQEGQPDVLTLMIWPNGTTWNESEQTVVTSNGVSITVGDHFQGSGGLMSDPDLLAQFVSDPDAVAEIDRCRTGDDVWVGYPDH